jgi:hypothetical protein
LKSKADQNLIWKQPSEENAQEEAEKIYKILSNLHDCLQNKPELENAINSKARFDEIVNQLSQFVRD